MGRSSVNESQLKKNESLVGLSLIVAAWRGQRHSKNDGEGSPCTDNITAVLPEAVMFGDRTSWRRWKPCIPAENRRAKWPTRDEVQRGWHISSEIWRTVRSSYIVQRLTSKEGLTTRATDRPPA